MMTFAELVASRRAWISSVLEPWCRQAPRKELLLAEMEWPDIAGRAPLEATLWRWAWSRFPALCSESLPTLDETFRVTVRCRDGRTATGYPDSRQSRQGELVLLDSRGDRQGPFSIDEIVSVEQIRLRE